MAKCPYNSSYEYCEIEVQLEVANAAESEYSKESIKGFINKVMQTNSGSMLARQIFCV